MRVRATVSFCGKVTMTAGEIREIGDPAVLADLQKAGYVIPAEKNAAEPPEEEKKTKKRRKA